MITKPLQYFNSTNIRASNPKIVLILNDFNGADLFFEQVKQKSKYWEKAYFFESYKTAYIWIIRNQVEIENLYIAHDYGFSKERYLRKLQSKNIYVYEEGLGSYIKDLRKETMTNLNQVSFLDRAKGVILEKFYTLLGNKNYHGGNRFTKGIYVYDIEKRKAAIPGDDKPLLKFERPFIEHLSLFADRDLLISSATFDPEVARNKKVVLYLSSWTVNDEVKKILESYPDYLKILKPHPHIKENINYRGLGFDLVFKGSGMVEFQIKDLLDVTAELIVVHHGTAAMLYYKNELKLSQVILAH